MSKKSRHICYGHKSSEQLLDECHNFDNYSKTIFSRLNRITSLPDYPSVLEVGPGCGSFIIVCSKLGYVCKGVDPCETSHIAAKNLSKSLEIQVVLLQGTA